MSLGKLALAILVGGTLFGCGSDENGSAPVVKVTPEQRAKDLDSEAESAVTWLEGMSPVDRQSAFTKSPQIATTLKGASDPALKSRIAALGLPLR